MKNTSSNLWRLGLLSATVCGMLAGTGCSAQSTDTRQKSESQGIAASAANSSAPKAGEAAAKAEPEKPKIAPALPALEGAHFPVFDLLVNRPLAHRIAFADRAPTLLVDANTPDFMRYIHGNHTKDWMLGTMLDKQTAAAIKARNASLWLPTLRPDVEQQLRLKVFNPAQWQNTLTVKVNGQALEPASLAEGWQEVTITVPADSKVRGDSQIDLSFSNMGRINGQLSGGAIAWVALGAALPDEAAAAEKAPAERDAEDKGAKQDEVADSAAQAGSGSAGGGEGATPAPDEEKAKETVEAVSLAAAALEKHSSMPLAQDKLTLDAETGMAWYIWVPKKGQLALDLHAPEECGVEFELYIEDPASKTGVKKATSVARNLVKARGTEQKTAIDLSEWSEQIARVELRGSDGCDAGEQVEIREASLVMPGERPAVPTGVKPPERIIMWVIDTLRADYLPLGFETDVQAPNLVKLAEEGAYFTTAYVQGNESRTSHAALFTGQYPSRNGLVGKGILHPRHYLFSEAVQDHGYKTAIHVANGYVSKNGGFAQGWNHYVNNLREGWGIKGEDIARHGLDWAKKNSEDPFLLYLGTIDPHVTYRAHKGITELYDTKPYNGRYGRYISGQDLGAIKGGRAVSERDKERIINLYKGEITYNDQAFGELRAGLEEAGLWEGTMVIVTSDHGEEFWEHGSVGHGHNVHQELVNVPLIVYYPPLINKNSVVTAGVDVIDVYPTILDALGAKRPDDLQGKSVIPLTHHVQGDYPEPAVATQYKIHYAMQMKQWKLYLKRGTYELYDRNADPLELKNVAEQHPLASRWTLDSMGYFRAHRERWNKETWGVASNLKPGFVDHISAE